MKRNSIIHLAIYTLVVFLLTSCLNGLPENTPTSASQNLLVMTFTNNATPANPITVYNSGLQYFGSGSLTYPPTDKADTATFAVTIQGPPTKKDINVTLKVDAGALKDNFANDSIVYQTMPDSIFKFITTTGVIKAGTASVNFQVIFYPGKIDPTKNFMAPVTATNDANIVAASNFGHIYFHTIGNPIAGAYTQEWIRWNNSTGTGTPNYDVVSSTVFAPVNPTTIQVSSGTGVIYNLTFKNVAGKLSNFDVSFTPASVTSAGITITGGPTVAVADPVNHQYEFHFSYNNASGSPRVIIDKFK